jgi:hypothetical protein
VLFQPKRVLLSECLAELRQVDIKRDVSVCTKNSFMRNCMLKLCVLRFLKYGLEVGGHYFDDLFVLCDEAEVLFV